MENKKVKRRLDEQAKVFTLVSNPKYCSVFRFTVRLKEKIDGEVLLNAYKQIAHPNTNIERFNK